MQMCANNQELKKRLDNAIGLGEIEWISPLECDEYRAYTLTGRARELKLDMKWDVWPSRQPQWDAIGLANKGKTLILVEAKANLNEMKTACRAKEGKGRQQIKKTIGDVLGSGYPDKWMETYYQIANRLVFLKKVMDNCGENRKAFCVFLYFANDCSLVGTRQRSIAEDAWRRHLDLLHEEVKKPSGLGDNVKEIVFDMAGKS